MPKKPFTPHERREITRLYAAERLTTTAIAARLGRSKSGVAGYLKGRGLIRHQREAQALRAQTKRERCEAALEVYVSGVSAAQAVKPFGISDTMLLRLAKARGVHRGISEAMRTMYAQRRDVTSADSGYARMVARAAYESGETYVSVAERFGIRPARVGYYVQRYAEKMGIDTPQTIRMRKNIEAVQRLVWHEGLTMDDAARALGVSQPSIHRYLKLSVQRNGAAG